MNFNFGRVEYYDQSAEFVRLAEVPFPSGPSFEEAQRSDGSTGLSFHFVRKHYLDCVVVGGRLFALFSGEVYDPASSVAPGAMGAFIHEFDWDGGLQGVYWLDRRVHALAASPEGTVIYGASIADGHVYAFPIEEGTETKR